MIANLRRQLRKHREQDWLKTNSQVTRMLQGQRPGDRLKLILSGWHPWWELSSVFYPMDGAPHEPLLKLLGTYAYRERKHLAISSR